MLEYSLDHDSESIDFYTGTGFFGVCAFDVNAVEAFLSNLEPVAVEGDFKVYSVGAPDSAGDSFRVVESSQGFSANEANTPVTNITVWVKADKATLVETLTAALAEYKA